KITSLHDALPICEKCHGDEYTDDHQNDIRWQLGVQICIRSTREHVIGGVEQFIASQPIINDFQQHPDTSGNSQLNTRRFRQRTLDSSGLISNADAAEYVVAN